MAALAVLGEAIDIAGDLEVKARTAILMTFRQSACMSGSGLPTYDAYSRLRQKEHCEIARAWPASASCNSAVSSTQLSDLFVAAQHL